MALAKQRRWLVISALPFVGFGLLRLLCVVDVAGVPRVDGTRLWYGTVEVCEVPTNSQEANKAAEHLEIRDRQATRDFLCVKHAIHAEAYAKTGVFMVNRDRREALKVEAIFGKAMFNVTEVISGLSEGDKIILSDMAEFDVVERVEIE